MFHFLHAVETKKQNKVSIRVTVHRDRFLFNNPPDALIIQILLCYKILYLSGIFSAHHQEFSTVHSALVSFMQVSDDRFQAESEFHHDSALKCLNSYSRELLLCLICASGRGPLK